MEIGISVKEVDGFPAVVVLVSRLGFCVRCRPNAAVDVLVLTFLMIRCRT
jgi:hypothetical protein